MVLYGLCVISHAWCVYMYAIVLGGSYLSVGLIYLLATLAWGGLLAYTIHSYRLDRAAAKRRERIAVLLKGEK